MLRTLSSLAFMCLLGSGVVAQEVSNSAHKTMLLTGCLREGVPPGTYKLTGATPSNPPAGAASASPTEYVLTLDTGLDRSGRIDAKAMTEQLGHKVEVTARPPDTAGQAPTSGAPETAAAKATVDKVHKLTVTAVKQLAASCS